VKRDLSIRVADDNPVRTVKQDRLEQPSGLLRRQESKSFYLAAERFHFGEQLQGRRPRLLVEFLAPKFSHRLPTITARAQVARHTLPFQLHPRHVGERPPPIPAAFQAQPRTQGERAEKSNCPARKFTLGSAVRLQTRQTVRRIQIR